MRSFEQTRLLGVAMALALVPLAAAKMAHADSALDRLSVPDPINFNSKHFGVLKQAGLVRDRHEGRQTEPWPR